MKDKNNELIVVKANEMIQNYKYTLSKTEMRVVNVIISNIKSPKYDTELNVMEFDIKDFCKMLGFDEGEAGGNQYKLLRKTLRGLSNKSSDYIDFGDKETIIRWIDKPIFEKGSGTVKLKLDDDLKPFLLQASGVMKSKLKYYFKMDSKYSMRLYELLKSWDGVKEKSFEINELRTLVDATQKTYSHFGRFRQTVLDPAVKEINGCTDLNVSYETKGKGKKVERVAFRIRKKSRSEIVALEANEEDVGLFSKTEIYGEAEALVVDDYEEVENENYDAEDGIADYEREDEETPEHLELFAAKLPGFTNSQLEVFIDLAMPRVPDDPCELPLNVRICEYILSKVDLMKAQKKPVAEEAKFAWIRKAIEENWR